MKERPIIFSGPMVRAILDGSKSETRRVIKPQPVMAGAPRGWDDIGWWTWKTDVLQSTAALSDNLVLAAPYQPGDRLWVRETWCPEVDAITLRLTGGVLYAADGHDVQAFAGDGHPVELVRSDGKPLSPWRSPIHMPRWASRILLELVEVRAERLQDINYASICREGYTHVPASGESFTDSQCLARLDGANNWYMALWDSINGKTYPWASNPWVWVLRFRRVT